MGALNSLIEDFERMVDSGLGSEQLRVFNQKPAGFSVDFHVVEQDGIGMLGLQFCDELLNLFRLLANPRQFFRFRSDTRRWRGLGSSASAAGSGTGFSRGGFWLMRRGLGPA